MTDIAKSTNHVAADVRVRETDELKKSFPTSRN